VFVRADVKDSTAELRQQRDLEFIARESDVPNIHALSNGSRLSCGALKKNDSFP
jgi:hypothetical protein